MNLPNLDVMFPQDEPILFTLCVSCSAELFIGDEIVNHAGYKFCDKHCMANNLIDIGLANVEVAGR